MQHKGIQKEKFKGSGYPGHLFCSVSYRLKGVATDKFSGGHPPLSYFNDLAEKFETRYNANDYSNLMSMYAEDVILISGEAHLQREKKVQLYSYGLCLNFNTI